MRIPSFSIQHQRGIAKAECANVPAFMIVAGPNGSGKSTLLNGLRQQPGDGPILYVGPHRMIRRQQVQYRQLIATDIRMRDMLARQDVPGGLEGVQITTGQRDAWNVDDASNFLKHGLCQVEADRQRAVAARYDSDGEIPKGSLPDPWQPLRQLTENLLPHLRFESIDTSHYAHVRCLWRVHQTDTVVDLDELSSGEKSIVQMFYPLVEQRIRARLTQIGGAPVGDNVAQTCVLIDEPELHLHPNLQLKVLDYLRALAAEDNTQIIVATHSPTMVEYASFEELFLLRPVELVSPGENQLIQVATDTDRLEALRSWFGGTTNLTALQPVLIVEGTTGHASDRKLYRTLSEKFDRATLIPGGGKGECIKLKAALAGALKNFSTRLRVCALLDADTTITATLDKDVFRLPVSMVENLLLDPDVLMHAMASIVDKTSLKTSQDIAQALDGVLDSMEASEADRRAVQHLGSLTFRPSEPLTSLAQQLESHTAALKEKFSDQRVKESISNARHEVDEAKNKSRRREVFDGKAALKLLFKRHVHNTGLSYEIFLFYAAQRARERKSVAQTFETIFNELLA